MIGAYVGSLSSMVCALIAMAFFTLVERKLLGYFMLRKGPNKCGILGIPQPLVDAVKLFIKERVIPFSGNSVGFVFFPLVALSLALILWSLFSFFYSSWFVKFGIILFLCLSSINVYTLLGSGFSSNSKYALLGALRSVAQTISYEISLSLTLLSAIMFLSSFSFSEIMESLSLVIGLLVPVYFIWMITCLAETMRTPFDHAEGESELVSGFNVEYGGGSFAFIFMAEYMNIMFLSYVSMLIFFNIEWYLATVVGVVVLSGWFVWVRATLPRMRYDKLMNLTWKVFLPVILGCFFLVILVICTYSMKITYVFRA